MKSVRTAFKTAIDSRVTAYLSACGAWLLGNGAADAEVVYGVIDKDVVKEFPLNATLGDAGVFSFLLAFSSANNQPYSACISAASSGTTRMATTGTVIGSNSVGDPAYGLKNFPTANAIGSGDFGFEAPFGLLFMVNSTANGVSAGEFSHSAPGYVGFRFTQLLSGTPTEYYGWLSIGPIAADYSSYHVYDWAYDVGGITPGAGRPAPVPEPSSLALLAMGAGGLTCYRLRRRRTDEAEQTTPAASQG